MLTNLAFAFICVRASSALVRTSAFLQPVVRGQVYIFEISPPLTKTTFNVYVSYRSQIQFADEDHAVYMFSLSNNYTIFVENHNL